MRRRQLVALLVSVVGGVAGAFLLDPRSGPRRRALIRDKLRHNAVALPPRLARTARTMRGPARGLLHTLAQRTPWHAPTPMPDADAFVAHRVRTALGREQDLLLGALNIDAIDGVVRVRGTVPDAQTARRVVEKAATVLGARAVMSLMRTPDGTPVGGRAGDVSVLEAGPRAAIHSEELRQTLKARWPSLTDLDIVASEGHISHLALLICAHSGEPEEAVRTNLDAIVQDFV
ncbi:MAG TPA: BON domain-containing protein [Dehalococcoidia bacterium]|nr:BON domain-containing protein [Dehalococcoidia bacterium]